MQDLMNIEVAHVGNKTCIENLLLGKALIAILILPQAVLLKRSLE
jgi:hypothetical protein